MAKKKSKKIKLTRKEFLRSALYGAAGLLVTDLFGSKLFAQAVEKSKAKSVIQIWMWGGSPHLDTFDPKPAAGRDYCGPYNKPLETNVPGIKICQNMPLLAKQADKYALLRGMTHGNNGHETASYLVQTGRKPDKGLVYPGAGAVVSHFKGQPPVYKGILPPYITLTTPQGRFTEQGFMKTKYKPFATGGDPNKEPFAVEGIVSESVSETRQKDRKSFLRDIDTFAREMAGDPLVKMIESCQEEAYSMIMGDARKTFELKEESKETRDLYGKNTFGQSCLLARRLVEKGVPYVTINYRGWDTHKKHFEAMNQKLPELDRGLAALLQDLKSHGLLDTTIVWCGGEFGRTPKVDWDAPWYGGRSHYGKAFSYLVAGGGFKGGKVVGQTDDKGENVIERKIYPWDLITSIYELLGIDKSAKLPHPQGITAYATAFADGETPPKETGGLLKEIM
ncbi:MAG: DUF1501 domain-containing protein [Candidatus Firestonebacteria bacterium]|nr:DUF1501 domain-containing protein [Candidatus Firestonebacteria bacterium]